MAFRSTRIKVGLFLLVLLTTFFLTPVINVFAEQASTAGHFRPLTAPVPQVAIDPVGNVKIGETFTFTVTFANTGDVPGYAPYVDLYFDATGIDGIYPGTTPGVDTYDGVSFISASYLGQPLEATTLTFTETAPGSGIYGAVHPYFHSKGTNPDGSTFKQYETILAPSGFTEGDQLVVLRLPFGSFVPGQPALKIEVTASLSALADLGTGLNLAAGGGFEFGTTELDDWCCEVPPSINIPPAGSVPVVPTLVTLQKNHTAEDGETATGPNYPLSYAIDLDFAAGQQILELTVQDFLPDNIIYQNNLSFAPAAYGLVEDEPLTDQPYAAPDNELRLHWVHPTDPTIAVVNGDSDASLTFEFFVPYQDASGNEVVPPAGADGNSCNDMRVSYTWQPTDQRDALVTDTVDTSACDVDLEDEALVLRKYARNVNPADPFDSPGDILRYTLAFEVSDYFALENMIITDIISDGQHFYTGGGYVPMLFVQGYDFVLPESTWISSYQVDCNYSGPPGSECTLPDPGGAGPAGSTELTFNISQEMLAQGMPDTLVGGCVDAASGGLFPACSGGNGPTTGYLVYYTQIQEAYTDRTGQPNLDQGDSLDNQAQADADVLSLADLSTQIGLTSDDDSASAGVPRGALSKAIYAINGSRTFNLADGIAPGDSVTYRLQYTLPTADVENFYLEDYLPLPVFRVGDPEADGTPPSPTWDFVDQISDGSGTPGSGYPAPGRAMFGPADDFRAFSGIVPTITADTAANKLTVFYGDFSNTPTTSTQKTVDILFTLVVTSDPFADGLFLTNQALGYESNTSSDQAVNGAIIQIKITEPLIMEISKSAVASSNPEAVLDGPDGGISFNDPGTVGIPWTGGDITSGILPINTNISGVDGGDRLRFAIIIENLGSSARGAFDLTIKDILPAGLEIPPEGLNLQIYNGAGENGLGQPIPFTYTGLGGGPDGVPNTEDDVFGDGIQIDDPDPGLGACQAHTIGGGRNIIIITYDLKLADDIETGEVLLNDGQLLKYASKDDGKNFLEEPLDDTSSVTVDEPTLEKTLVSTSLDEAGNDTTHAVVGEEVTYALKITLPEGEIQDLIIRDLIPGTLMFESYQIETSAADSEGLLDADYAGIVTVDSDLPLPVNPGDDLYLTLASPTTNPADNDPTNDSFLVFVTMRVVNTTAVQDGLQITNRGRLTWVDAEGNAQTLTERDQQLEVIEPQIDLTKNASVSELDAGDPISYTITAVNSLDLTAYDAVFTDQLPCDALGSLILLDFAAGVTVTDSAGVITKADFELVTDANGCYELRSLPGISFDLVSGQTITLTVDGTVVNRVSPTLLLENTASMTWTSLDGDDPDERTGEDGSGGLNDYIESVTEPVTVNNVLPQKTVFSTSESHTTGTDVVIGEVVRYRLEIALPEGTSTQLTLQDFLPEGLTYQGNAVLAFVANDGGSCNISSDASGLSGSGLCVVGSDATVDSIVPSFVFPSSLIENADDPGNAFASGDDPIFDLGTLINDDRDADFEYILIMFDALVANLSSNQAGVSLENAFAVYQDGALLETSPGVDVLVLEPSLLVDKQRTGSIPVDAGDLISYTLTITAENNSTSTTAYDLILYDVLPTALIPYLDLTGPVLISAPVGANAIDLSVYAGSPDIVMIGADQLAPGEQITVQVTAKLLDVLPVGLALENTAGLNWTSLEGFDPNERDGTETGPNDYAHEDTEITTPTGAPLVDKLPLTNPTGTIGDDVVYTIKVTLAEGLTRQMRLEDLLPAGMTYRSSMLITSAAASGGLLSADFNGTISLTGTPTTGDTGTLTFTFGNVTTTGDNVVDNNSFLLQLTARIENQTTNQIDVVLENNAQLVHTPENGGGEVVVIDPTPVDLTIIEPRLTLVKTVSPETGVEAGDTLTYTLVMTNTGTSPAYEVSIVDQLAQGTSFDTLISCQRNPGAVDLISGTTVDTAAAGQIGLSNPLWDLEVGESLTCMYTVTALDTLYIDGDHTNTADADWTNRDGEDPLERDYDDTVDYDVDGDQDTDTAVFTVDSLTLEKSADVSQVVVGGTVTFTLRISGPDGTVRDLVVEDLLPLGLIYLDTLSISGTSAVVPDVSTPNDGTAAVSVTWDFGNAVKSGDIVIIYTAQAADVASNINLTDLINDVTLSHTEANGDPAPAIDDSTTVTIAEPDLTISKDFDQAPPNSVGAEVVYAITIQHSAASTADAHQIHFTDTLPASLDLNLSSISCSAACVDASSGNLVDLTFAQLAMGDQITITFSAVLLTSVEPGQTIENVGVITWENSEGISRPDDTDSDQIDFSINEPAITKTLLNTSAGHTADASVAIGEHLTYTLTITLPEGTTTTLQVIDSLPAGLAYVNGSALVDEQTADNGNPIPSPSISVTAGTIQFDFGEIVVEDADPASDSDTFDITLTAVVENILTNQDGVVLTNNASVQADSGPTIPADPVDVNILEPAVEIEKAVSNPNPGPGEVFTFTLTVQHLSQSSADAFDLIITDTLPTGLSFDGTTSTPSGWNVTINGQTITFTGDLDLTTNSLSMQYAVTVDEGVSVSTALTNAAELTYTSLPGDDPDERTGDDGSGGLNDYADLDEETIIFSGVDLTLVKTDGGAAAQPGDVVSYTLTITNVGNITATSVIITETIPAHTSFVGPVGWTVDPNDPTKLTYDCGDLAPGASLDITFDLEIESPLAAGVSQIENTAVVTSEETDANPDDNTDQDDTPVVAQPALDVVKDDGLSIVAPGAEVVYTITVTNTGNQDAAGVVLVDYLPDEVRYAQSSPEAAYDETDHELTWTAFNLGAGESRTFTVTVEVLSLEELQDADSFENLAVATDDGSGTNGQPLSDADSDLDQIAVSGLKNLIETNQAYSAQGFVFIGEVLTYEISLLIPPGEMQNLQALDNLHPGLAFESCLGVTVSDPNALQTTLQGGFAAACPEDSGDPHVTNAGRQILFTFGDVTNQSDYSQTITVRYTVDVLNILENVAGVDDLNNTVTWTWNGGQLEDSAPTVEIIEPDMSIDKDASPTTAPLNSVITFTLSIAHTAQSTADAFDVLVVDQLPPGLAYIGNITSVGLPYDQFEYDTSNSTITIYWAHFGLLESATITFEATFIGPPDVINSASVSWTSLPLDPGLQSDYNEDSTERNYDPADPSGVNTYGASDRVILRVPKLPETGFAPGVVTPLPQPSAAYIPLSDFTLTIRDLDLSMPVVGIPLDASGWDLTWLGESAGYLQGSTYPTEVGNTVLTAHVTLPDGKPGPFENLASLRWGQEIHLEVDDVIYVYEVRQNLTVLPEDLSIFREDGYAWLTLITCKDFDADVGAYLRREVIRAVLIEVIEK